MALATQTKSETQTPWFSWIAKVDADGSLEPILGQLAYTMLSTLKLNRFERHEGITDIWLRAYSAPFKAPEYCLGARDWARGVGQGAHRFEPADALIARALSHKPELAVWGMADRTLQPEHFVSLFHEAFPNGVVHRLEGVGHYCHEDAPQEIPRRIEAFRRGI